MLSRIYTLIMLLLTRSIVAVIEYEKRNTDMSEPSTEKNHISETSIENNSVFITDGRGISSRILLTSVTASNGIRI